jgi:hypothetical protein
MATIVDEGPRAVNGDVSVLFGARYNNGRAVDVHFNYPVSDYLIDSIISIGGVDNVMKTGKYTIKINIAMLFSKEDVTKYIKYTIESVFLKLNWLSHINDDIQLNQYF